MGADVQEFTSFPTEIADSPDEFTSRILRPSGRDATTFWLPLRAPKSSARFATALVLVPTLLLMVEPSADEIRSGESISAECTVDGLFAEHRDVLEEFLDRAKKENGKYARH